MTNSQATEVKDAIDNNAQNIDSTISELNNVSFEILKEQKKFHKDVIQILMYLFDNKQNFEAIQKILKKYDE